jgi:hypothetical protein
MEQNKLTNPALGNSYRSTELREIALAELYPLTHSGISAHHKRAVDRLPVLAARPPLGHMMTCSGESSMNERMHDHEFYRRVLRFVEGNPELDELLGFWLADEGRCKLMHAEEAALFEHEFREL